MRRRDGTHHDHSLETETDVAVRRLFAAAGDRCVTIGWDYPGRTLLEVRILRSAEGAAAGPDDAGPVRRLRGRHRLVPRRWSRERPRVRLLRLRAAPRRRVGALGRPRAHPRIRPRHRPDQRCAGRDGSRDDERLGAVRAGRRRAAVDGGRWWSRSARCRRWPRTARKATGSRATPRGGGERRAGRRLGRRPRRRPRRRPARRPTADLLGPRRRAVAGRQRPRRRDRLPALARRAGRRRSTPSCPSRAGATPSSRRPHRTRSSRIACARPM